MKKDDVDIQINFESLLKQGYAVIDVRYKNYEVTDEDFKFIIVRVERDRDEFYKNMLKHYIGKRVPEKGIYELWIKILQHKLKMSETLGRDISIKVAALDYLEV